MVTLDTTTLLADAPEMTRRSRFRSTLRTPAGAAGAVIVTITCLLGIAAPWLAPYDAGHQIPGASLSGASANHWLGTDELGRDILSRLLFGIRQNVWIVAVAVPLGSVTGIVLGLVSTVHRRIDTLVQRILDVLIAFPNIIFGACLAAFLGAGFGTVVIVVIVVTIPQTARLTRTAVMTQRERDYVLGARAAGASSTAVMVRHVLPNSLDSLIVNFVLAAATAIFVEGGLSLLGFGIQPPAPSLGSMIDQGLPYMSVQPLAVLAPIVVITVLVIGLNMVADALNRAIRRG